MATNHAVVNTRETADRIAKDFADFPSEWDRKLSDAIDEALTKAITDERARAARIIKEHRESDRCEGDCWEIITSAIRGKSK